MSRPTSDPVFILGNQKSGTSAVAALLAKATGLSVSIDLKMQVVCPLYDHLRSGSLSFGHFVRVNSYSFSKKLVKEPELTFHYRELVRHFPNSYVVFVHREPTENLRSIYERLGFAGNVIHRERRHVEHLPRAWQMILHSDHFPSDTLIPVLDNLCKRWNDSVETEIMAGDSKVSVSYEEFKRDKQRVIHDLATQLGLPVRFSILDALDANYQPPSTSGLSAREFFSQESFERIQNLTRRRASKIGYTWLTSNNTHTL